jgi:hypothetical protein
MMALPVQAQTSNHRHAQTTAAVVANDPAALLPTSDALVTVDVKRVLNEAVPLFLSEDPAKLADINNEIAKFKTQTGLDIRSFDRVALGIRFNSPRPGITTGDTVAIAKGSFNASALLAAGKIAANGNYREEKYNGSTIYIFNLKDSVKLPLMISTKVSELAVCVLDPNTLALGDRSMIRATLDARNSPRRNSGLLSLAGEEPGAFLSFSANVPETLTNNVQISNDEVAKNIKSIRQVYGSVGIVANQLHMVGAAKTNTTDDAQSLSGTLTALKQFAPMAIGQLPVDIRPMAQNALDNLKIEQTGPNVRLSLSIPQADVASLMRSFKKKA